MTNDEAARPRPAKAILYSQPSPWIRAHCRDDFPVTSFGKGARILDVGCGYGKNLEQLQAAGFEAEGIDSEDAAVEYCAGLGLKACLGTAEDLPFAEAAFDGAVIDGVLQFTDPSKALAELHRVLKPGGRLLLVTQAIGYGLYTTLSRKGRTRFFGLRMMLHSLWFSLARRRLGDTTCFSPSTTVDLCSQAGFRVIRAAEGRRFFGLPVFVYVEAVRP